jgi:hypothetical protein
MRSMRMWMVVGALAAAVAFAGCQEFYLDFYYPPCVGSGGGMDAGAGGGGGYCPGWDGGSDE